MKEIFVLLIFSFFLFGCLQPSSDSEKAIEFCKKLCSEKKSLIDFSLGPCLSNEIIPDWVCDVAHNPREQIDNLPENQCSAFREGRAKHFVELDTDCKIIKTD